MNIVTLLPSATEIVCALGLKDQLVGVSHSCRYPTTVGTLPKMTSTRVPVEKSSGEIDAFVREHLTSHEALYDLDLDKLRAVNPDVIISQALCDVCAVSTGDVLAALEGLPSRPHLIDLEPNTLDDVLADIENVGQTLGVSTRSLQLVDRLRERREKTAAITARIRSRPRVAFLEWLDPPFCGGHWNPEIVELAGGIDLLGRPAQPSTTLAWDQVYDSAPDVVFIACCGFPRERAIRDLDELSRDCAWQALPAVKAGRVYVVDGSAYFSSPNPRLFDGMEIMAHALHPNHHPNRWPQVPFRP